VARRVLPEIPAKAQATIRGTVRIRVKVEVDGSGNVTGAALDGTSSGRYFEPYALAAARKWKFEPGNAGDWMLRFVLRRSGTEAQASRSH
jgi:TonB family protein